MTDPPDILLIALIWQRQSLQAVEALQRCTEDPSASLMMR